MPLGGRIGVRADSRHIDHTGNINSVRDLSLAGRVNDAVYDALLIHDAGAIDRGAKDERGLDVLSDPSFGNITGYHPIRGAFAEIEFIDVQAVDELLNTNENHQIVRQSVANDLGDALIEDIRHNPPENAN